MSFKIIIHSMPATGHINPIAAIVKHLVFDHKCHCICYSLECFKKLIERTGAEFRCLKSKMSEFKLDFPTNKRSFRVGILIDLLIDLSEKNSIEIAKDIEKDKPDLIIIDPPSYHAKLALRYYEARLKIKNENNGTQFCPSLPLPPTMCYETSFSTELNIFPNREEQVMMFNLSFYEKMRCYCSLLTSVIKTQRLSKELGINFIFPLTEIFMMNPELKIVTIYPFIQPRHHLCKNSTKFIGACIDETTRNIDNESEDLQMLLDTYSVSETKESFESIKNDKYLIYIALGTVFYENITLYSKIIDAMKLIEKENNEHKRFDYIIAVGRTQAELKEKYTNLPSNMIICKNAPQLEILKRASLFITHCGMNSINEAIYYGVPCVCIPLNADQPVIAHRASMELGIGITLDFVKMKPLDIKNAALSVLNDKRYLERSLSVSEMCRKKTGKLEGCKEILNLLESKKIIEHENK